MKPLFLLLLLLLPLPVWATPPAAPTSLVVKIVPSAPRGEFVDQVTSSLYTVIFDQTITVQPSSSSSGVSAWTLPGGWYLSVQNGEPAAEQTAISGAVPQSSRVLFLIDSGGVIFFDRGS